MKKIFPILLLMTLISFLGVPDVVDVPTITFLGKTITEIQCSSILTVLDMLLFFYFDAHSKWEQNRNMQLGFKAINELPNYTEYIEYEQPNGAFQYELKNNQNDHNSSLPNKKNRVDCESFYGQKIPISKNAEACVAVPMLMSIKSKSNAVKLRISNIELYELENSAYVKLSLSKQHLQLNNQNCHMPLMNAVMARTATINIDTLDHKFFFVFISKIPFCRLFRKQKRGTVCFHSKTLQFLSTPSINSAARLFLRQYIQ